MQVSGPLKEDTVTGPKIAAVERREACVLSQKHAAPSKVPDSRRSAFRRSASLAWVREERRGRTQKRVYARLRRAMAHQTAGAMNHVCMDTPFESKMFKARP